MKFIKLFIFTSLFYCCFTYGAEPLFSIKIPSEPVQLRYCFYGHGGRSDAAKIDFNVSSEKVSSISITNLTLEACFLSNEEKINPEASRSITIYPNTANDNSFYLAYYIGTGVDLGAKGRNLMVTSGNNELLVDIDYSDGTSSKGVEVIAVNPQMYY